MHDKKHRRVFQRFDPYARCRAKLILADEIIIKDISMGGMRIETSRRLTINSRYKIQLISRDNEIITPVCVVVREFLRSRLTGADRDVPVYEVGLKFVLPDDDERNFLEKLINEISRGNEAAGG